MEKEEMTLRNRHGKRLPATLRRPDGEPKGTMVVLHGLAAWKDQFTVVAMAEAGAHAGYQTLAFDGSDSLRGPDAKYWNSTPSGFIEDAEDVIDFIQKQNWYVGPLILAGHSLGGMCAVRYARQHPGVVSKLILVSPAISWLVDRSSKFFSKIRFTTKVVRIVRERERQDGEKYFNPLYPPWILDFIKFDTRKDAPHIPVPVLIISAADDLVVAGPEAHEALAKRFPEAKHVIIEGASHLYHKHERQLHAAMEDWLAI